MSVASCVLKKTTAADVGDLTNLINSIGGQSLYRSLFGSYNFSNLIEFSVLSLTARNHDGIVGGVVAFNDGCVGAIDSFDDIVGGLKHGLPDIQVANCLLLNFLAYNTKVCGQDVGSKLMQEAFSRFTGVHYIVYLCPNASKAPPFITNYMKEVNISEESGDLCSALQKSRAFVARRSDFLPKLQVRQARIEDNDDLLPILRKSNPALVNGQEEFFLADLITAQDERNKIYVGVVNDKPVGMLAVSREINASLLNRVFDLEPYSGLVTAGEGVLPPKPVLALIVGQLRHVNANNVRNCMAELGGAFVDTYSSLGNQTAVFSAKTIFSEASRAIGDQLWFCATTGFPRTESEAEDLAALMRASSSEWNIVVIEVQPMMNDDMLDDGSAEMQDPTEAEEAMESAIERLRAHVTGGSVPNVNWCNVNLPTRDDARKTAGNESTSLEFRLNSLYRQYQSELSELREVYEESLVANAFAVTLFSINSMYETRAEDLMRFAFESNEFVDYGIALLPLDSPGSSLTACMFSPRIRPGVSFDEALFLVHRDHLLTSHLLTVDRFQPEMASNASKFLSTLSPAVAEKLEVAMGHAARDQEVSLTDNPLDICFVARVRNNIVGIVSLSRHLTSSENINWLRRHYAVDEVVNLERHRASNQAMITQWVISPVFYKSCRFILKEVMRLYEKSLLYFEMNEAECAISAEILIEMSPVRPDPNPRASVHAAAAAKSESADDAAPDDDAQAAAQLEALELDKKIQRYPLFAISKLDISEAKILRGHRIVVVGGNASALAALEAIVFSRNIYFMNIFFVSESNDSLRTSASQMIASHLTEQTNLCGALSVRDCGDPSLAFLSALGIEHRVTLVTGRLTDIDRNSRAVVISDEVALEYDILLIASATQDAAFKKYPSISQVHPMVNAKRGIFGLGNAISDAAAVDWVMSHVGTSEGRVAVVGAKDHGVAAVGALLAMGVPANKIFWLSCSDKGPYDVGYSDMNNMLDAALRSTDVTAYEGAVDSVQLSDYDGSLHSISVVRKKLPWEHLLNGGVVSAGGAGEDDVGTAFADADDGEDALLRNKTEGNGLPAVNIRETVSCSAVLFCVNPHQCDIDVYSAIRDCGLVFDGGVVVDKNFCTVDPNIFAVGPFTRFSRRYKNAPLHHNYNAREVGLYVADCLMRSRFEREASSAPASGSRRASSAPGPSRPASRGAEPLRPPFDLPVLQKPRIVEFRAGPLFCFRSFQPDQQFNMAGDITSMKTHGDSPENITVLKVGTFGVVQELSYLGSEPVPHRRMGHFVGMQESFLNSAVYCFEHAQVRDWVKFFSGPWVDAVLHENFGATVAAVQEAIRGEKDVLSLFERLADKAEAKLDETSLAAARREAVGARASMISDRVRNAVESGVVEFMRQHKGDLQGFHIPSSSGSAAAK